MNWFKILFYLSILFLLVALSKANYLNVPLIYDKTSITLSFVTLFAGFVFFCLANGRTLGLFRYPVSLANACSMLGLTVFTKYIPGKVGMVVSPASYLHQKYGYPLKPLIAININIQFIALWVGLVLGAVGLYLLNDTNAWGPLLLTGLAVLSVLVFSRVFHHAVEKIVYWVLRKNYSLPQLNFRDALRSLPWFFLYFGTWSASFYFLVAALTPATVSWQTGLAFPLASALGVIALFAPGGIGVREGVLTTYLVMTGLDIKSAATISIASRLWYLTGEIFIFVLGFALDKRKKQN